jgi:hypothetical protein
MVLFVVRRMFFMLYIVGPMDHRKEAVVDTPGIRAKP